jgi:predicted RecA/RadA family phage recombinase
VVGALFGVAACDAGVGEEVEIVTTGIFDLPKDGTALAAGGPAYYDSSEGKITNAAAAGNYLVGVSLTVAGVGATIARVRLDGVATI